MEFRLPELDMHDQQGNPVNRRYVYIEPAKIIRRPPGKDCSSSVGVQPAPHGTGGR